MKLITFNYSSLNGVLRYLYYHDPKYYSRYLTIERDSIYRQQDSEEKAFDFNSETYWTSAEIVKDSVWLSFCFVKGYVKLTGFEIQTSRGGRRPKSFQFGFSTDNLNYQFQDFEVSLNVGESVYRQYESHNYFKCFKYASKASNSGNTNKNRTDIAQFELFGSFIGDLNLHLKCTSQCRFPHLHFSIILFSFLIPQK